MSKSTVYIEVIKNHSSDFWKLVSLALPDYQERRDWLKNNAAIFRL